MAEAQTLKRGRSTANLLFRTCNDGDLVESMIGHGIQVMFDKQFWLHTTGKASDGRPLICPYKGTILDMSLRHDWFYYTSTKCAIPDDI